MAVLCQFPTTLSSFRKLLLSSSSSSSSSVQLPSFHFHRQHHCCSRISASSLKNQRKAKSNVELCKEIKEFLSSAGLPENHVPSTKELSQHGRQDLANIVRRRGYKYIRQMLDESNTAGLKDASQDGKSEELSVSECESEGPDENLEVLSGEVWSREGIRMRGFNNGLGTSEFSTLSLQENVTNFIDQGEFDAIEVEVCGVEIGDANEVDGSNESKHANKPDHTSSDPQQDLSISFSSEEETLYQNVPPSPPKSDQPEFEKQTRNDKEDLVSKKARNLDSQAEINRLKSLLHQKETELAQLKQQIEKEKLSLSILQSEAKREISRVQKLIAEKDTQLQAVEESLSGLKEVEILYPGEGKVVELAGSFNGWQQTIKMDLHTPDESSTSRVWRAVVWLYPGVYEIKFIVDGQWKIDPLRESISRGSLQNNILQVER